MSATAYYRALLDIIIHRKPKRLTIIRRCLNAQQYNTITRLAESAKITIELREDNIVHGDGEGI